ncbi:DNA-3-methyladenine glycosylase I [Lapidilactobacillus mulanensis]|uniref:DNA-3-methyladenine glycosylase I n=1 Tax=Lapidilactobacillus mulanensis TaxID=2485999 RepID=A0ABW4DPE8_9LACO|nr:DNA-3-methyladenine glycosylase I [Lapidilactobacillus mulanensis]
MSRENETGIQEYDRLFGQATHDEQILFEFLVIAVFQAGLSWKVAASKIPIFRQVFADFDYHQVAGFDEPELETIMKTDGMIRNPRKVQAIITNARAIMQLAPEFPDFNSYLWHFTENNAWTMQIEPGTPPNQQSSLGTIVAKDMKKRGFKFVGPTTVQLLLIASGIIKRTD